MINSYNLLTGFQIIAAAALLIYACYFHKERQCMPFIIVAPYVLLLLWGCVVIYYYSVFLALSVLWFLLGGLLGAAAAAYCRKWFPVLQASQDSSLIQCPKRPYAPVILLLAAILFAGTQIAVYYFPFLTYFWWFNELLGFVPGVFLGWLWGRALAMLARAQLARTSME